MVYGDGRYTLPHWQQPTLSHQERAREKEVCVCVRVCVCERDLEKEAEEEEGGGKREEAGWNVTSGRGGMVI